MTMRKVGLLGVGKWGTERWLPALASLVQTGRITLSLADVETQPPDRLLKYLKLPGISYVPWRGRSLLQDLDAVVIAVPAKKHYEVIRELLFRTRKLKKVVCEKPAGDSLAEFCRIAAACKSADVDLTVVDHYLLRPSVQRRLGQVSAPGHSAVPTCVDAYMLEAKREGPPEQDANLDMLVHPLNVIHALLPGTRLVVDRAIFGRALDRPHANVTYCLVQGVLEARGTRIPCRIEVGKQVRDDKRIVLEGQPEIGLSAATNWSYVPLLEALLLDGGAPKALEQLGGLSANHMLQTWTELEEVRSQLHVIERYSVGNPPAGSLSVPAHYARPPEDPVLLRLAKAKRLARLAGERLVRSPVPRSSVRDRGTDDLTTPADLESEDLLRRGLPEDGELFIGEETEQLDERHVQIEAHKSYWIVDPVDGTQNLVAGRPEVAVSIAYWQGTRPVFGVVHMPARDATVALWKDGVLEVNDLLWSLEYRPPSRLSDAVVALPGDLRRLGGTPVRDVFGRVLNRVAGVRVTGALAYDLACLALGEIDARISSSVKLVDVAAGIRLVRGMGGLVTDWEGRDWVPGAATLLASRSPEIHSELLGICRRAAPEEKPHPAGE